MDARSQLPPRPRLLQKSLKEMTEFLAKELSRPSSKAPELSPQQWTVARAVAVMHGISPLLASTLRWQGPDDWNRFLRAQREHTQRRQLRMTTLLGEVDRLARDAGVPLLALKGAQLHAMGLYQAGDRPTADIDLLVRPNQGRAADTLMRMLGYGQQSQTWRERVFVPLQSKAPALFGEHADNAIKIEIHERVAEKLSANITDISRGLFPLSERAGLNPYRSRAALLLHLLLHAAGSISTQGLRLLQLSDLSRLCASMSKSDWAEFRAMGEEYPMWWAYPPALLTVRYFDQCFSADMLADLRDRCPAWLRRSAECCVLHQVSYSYLWVDAFPAMVWSQSLRDMLSYAASRVRPSREHTASRQRELKLQLWANSSEWSRLPQSRRILRWLISRQTRPATLHAVTAAFAERNA